MMARQPGSLMMRLVLIEKRLVLNRFWANSLLLVVLASKLLLERCFVNRTGGAALPSGEKKKLDNFIKLELSL